MGEKRQAYKERVRRSRRPILKVGLRLGITVIAVLIQVAVFALVLLRGTILAPWLGVASVLLSVSVVAFILNSRMEIEYKLAWIIPIMVAPLFGGAFYLLFGSRRSNRRHIARYREIRRLAGLELQSSPGAVKAIASLHSAEQSARVSLIDYDRERSGSESDSGTQTKLADPDRSDLEPGGEQPFPADVPHSRDNGDIILRYPGHTVDIHPKAVRQLAYLESAGPYMAYRDTETTYYPVGEPAFEAMLEALNGAKKWIAMEYFIVSAGIMWDQICDVLVRKANEGVKIWFLYDDLGSLWHLPDNLEKDLKSAGIEVRAFNRLGPGLTLRYNNRDHRKFTIVDGLIAFTGGINLADEYINKKQRFGHWKDTVLRLRGPGAWGMASLFFSLWDMLSGKDTDMSLLRPTAEELAKGPHGTGLVLSFDDTPVDDKSLGWVAYRGLMSRATVKVDLTTPYLVPTGEMISFFNTLARSGVRVRIITPGIPDKAYVYSVTRSNYRRLLEAGVEIYEYTPGFIHAKQMVVDDEIAILGTINFDFRSFYLHYENAVWMCKTSAIAEMSADIERIVAQSRRVSLDEMRSVSWWTHVKWLALRTFSPLL